MDLREDLTALRKALPYGAIVRIAKQMDRTRGHVEAVLEGKYNDESVIDLAIAELDRERERKLRIRQRIQRAVSAA